MSEGTTSKPGVVAGKNNRNRNFNKKAAGKVTAEQNNELKTTNLEPFETNSLLCKPSATKNWTNRKPPARKPPQINDDIKQFPKNTPRQGNFNNNGNSKKFPTRFPKQTPTGQIKANQNPTGQHNLNSSEGQHQHAEPSNENPWITPAGKKSDPRNENNPFKQNNKVPPRATEGQPSNKNSWITPVNINQPRNENNPFRKEPTQRNRDGNFTERRFSGNSIHSNQINPVRQFNYNNNTNSLPRNPSYQENSRNVRGAPRAQISNPNRITEEEFESIFNIKKTVQKKPDWVLPDVSLAYSSRTYEFDNFQAQKEEMNATKDVILENYPYEKWRVVGNKFGVAQRIITVLKYYQKLGHVVRNWPKAYEIFSSYPLISSGKLNSIHIGDHHGGVINALNHYLHSKFEDVQWKWKATCDNPYYEDGPSGDR